MARETVKTIWDEGCKLKVKWGHKGHWIVFKRSQNFGKEI